MTLSKSLIDRFGTTKVACSTFVALVETDMSYTDNTDGRTGRGGDGNTVAWSPLTRFILALFKSHFTPSGLLHLLLHLLCRLEIDNLAAREHVAACGRRDFVQIACDTSRNLSKLTTSATSGGGGVRTRTQFFPGRADSDM